MRRHLSTVAGAALLLSGCAPVEPGTFQGYLEGEFVYVASPLAGRLDSLNVSRGDQISAGAPLFSLENDLELAALSGAESELRASQARLEDLRKGSRPSEIAALEARLTQAQATAELSRLDFERQRALHDSGVLSDRNFDESRMSHERNLAAVEEVRAMLETARLGGRPDAITAAEAAVAAATAARAKAAWDVDQKSVNAPVTGLVQDTLYRTGEFVAMARPVVVLLPPENIKARFFVPQEDLATLSIGMEMHVLVTGRTGPLTARITYISSKPEYTPPVLYNRENRAKLVYLVEARLDPADARDLHPGQPVDVMR